jgi:hypothetical protein
MDLGSAAVHRFTLHLETPQGTTSDEAVWAKVEEAMRASTEVIEAETTFDQSTGTIGATFGARAETLDDAQDMGLRVFTEALDGADAFYDGWLFIEASGP